MEEQRENMRQGIRDRVSKQGKEQHPHSFILGMSKSSAG